MNTIIGQPHAVDVLRSALRSGRLHHAWVFAGPRGVGKRTTAVEFARILLDPDAAPDASGEIVANADGRSSKLIDAGSHPDLHIITKEMALYSDNPQLRSRKLRNIPVDLLRERMIGGRTSDDRIHQAPAYRTPSLGHGKVFILDEAELIDAVGQNVLLKTLEEPPPDTYIILVTAHPEQLLPTIRSRAQHVVFGPLADGAMRTWFERSGLDLTEGDRGWIEEFADGSPGRARIAAEHGFHAWHDRIIPMIDELDRGAFPVELGQTLNELVDEYASACVKAMPEASKDAANKDGAGHLLALLAAHARQRLIASLCDRHEMSRWLEVIDLIAGAERQLAANVNQRMVLENLVAQWSSAGCAAV